MSTSNDILITQLFDAFVSRSGESSKIPDNYIDKMQMVNELKRNDYTGIVNTVLEYMIKAGTVDFSFQTPDAGLRKYLNNWANTVNKDLNVDIQRGLKAVTTQYLRERWYSSFIGMQIGWAKIDGYFIPENIWLVDGANITVSGDTNLLAGYKYSIGKKDLKTTSKTTTIIRKPFNSWYEQTPDPYLIKKGTLYNSLLKRELLKKQGDMLEAIIPYMLAIKAGNDALAKLNMLPEKEDLEKLVDSIKKIKREYGSRLKSKGTVGGFAHDVTFEHVIPDLAKIFDEKIIKPIDRNIFASLGMIELSGFSSNREEAIMNPKMLIEEVKDAVSDLTLIYEDIILAFKEKNKLENKDIRVVPGIIKSFITDNMRILARSAYDRGIISRQTWTEDYLDLDFEVEVQRSDVERRRNLAVRMFPPVIMNQDNGTEPDAQKPDTQSPEKNVPGTDIKATCTCSSCGFVWAEEEDLKNEDHVECPECKELLLVVDAKEEKFLQAPYENIDELPAQTDVLPKNAKKIFMKVVNEAIKKGLSDKEAFKLAWHTVKLSYEKDEKTGKWKRKKKVSTDASDEE